jgi:hypothetical protein
MILAARTTMGKAKGGRPPRDAGDQATRQVRVFSDLAEMIAEVVEVVDVASANLLDPILRPDVEALHEKHLPRILKLRAAKEQLRRTEEEVRGQVSQEGEGKPRPRRRTGG